MVSYAVRMTVRGGEYLRSHPQLLFVLTLLIVIPLLFLYSGQQFLDAGRANQDRLQRDKVGILHDAFVSLIISSNFNVEIMQAEIERISRVNNDISDFRVVTLEDGVATPVAALDRERIGKLESFPDMFINSTVRTDESLIFEIQTNDGRAWLSYRSVRNPETDVFYIIHTQTSLAQIDKLFLQREQSALFSLVYIFVFILGLAYWHIRMSDYRYLYLTEKKHNEAKDTFINVAAHELRAPLTAMKGYAELLEEHITDTTQKEYVARISDSTERLLEMVTDLLDVARIQSGTVEVVLGYVDVSAVVQNVIAELTVTAQAKNITLFSSGAETPHQAVADKARLHQVLTNVINNAIKYTPKGSIEVVVTAKHRSLEIRIKDTGMGIEAEDQKKLFAPFFRVKTADVTSITGTGLGMWITKQLISIMHGSIGVESISGVGTHIVITLPTKSDVVGVQAEKVRL
jgi:signal transduction histidine kinase